MVLSTDNQEKEPPCESSLLIASKLPGAPSLDANVPPYSGVPPLQKPTWIYPLAETGGEFGPTWVHKPFSLLGLRQIKQDLESYTDAPSKYMYTFQHITLVFDLTWKSIIFSQTFEEGNGNALQYLVWKTRWTEEPSRLPSMGSLRVGHDWVTSLSILTFMYWRRKWQPTPVFLPGESQGWGSLVGCHLWGLTELYMTEVT